MNEQFYNVSANPHVRDKASTHSIMLDVLLLFFQLLYLVSGILE